MPSTPASTAITHGAETRTPGPEVCERTVTTASRRRTEVRLGSGHTAARADVARRAARGRADGRGDQVGGAVDGPRDRRGRVRERGRYLLLRLVLQHARVVTGAGDHVLAADVDERDGPTGVRGHVRRRVVLVHQCLLRGGEGVERGVVAVDHLVALQLARGESE